MRQYNSKNSSLKKNMHPHSKQSGSLFLVLKPEGEKNSHSAEAAENWVCAVCLCGACVWALIKDRRLFKHIRAILSNCLTPSSISTHTKSYRLQHKAMHTLFTLFYLTEQASCRQKWAETRGITLSCSTSGSTSLSMIDHHFKGIGSTIRQIPR